MSILTQLSLTAVVALSLNAAADEPNAAPRRSEPCSSAMINPAYPARKS